MQLVHQKFIGVLHFNALGLQNSLRKVFGDEGDDGVGYDMPVVDGAGRHGVAAADTAVRCLLFVLP